MKTILRVVLFFILLVIFSENARTQQLDYFENIFSDKSKIFGFKMDNYFSNNTLIGSLVLDYINGKFISEDEKDKCISNFKDEDIKLGEIFDTEISYRSKFGNSNYFLGLMVGEHIHYETQLNKDIFLLLFKGNKNFENKFAGLHPLDINLLQYLYIKLGLQKMGGSFSFYANVGYAGGQRMLNLKSYRGSLFTAPQGKFIDLDLNLKSYDVSPDFNTFFDWSGSGLIGDVGLRYKISKNTDISVDLNGIGFINWTKGITEREVDTIYHTEGLEITSILDSFSIAIKDVEDLKSSFIKERSVDKIKSTLPYSFSIGLSQFIIPNRLQLLFKYQYLHSDIANQLLYGSVNYFLSERMLLGLNLTVGGHGRWNAGSHFGVVLFNRACLQLNFNSFSTVFDLSQPLSLTGGVQFKLGL